MISPVLRLQLYDQEELLTCIKKLVELDQDWVPFSQDASLYIRPTFIGTEVTVAPPPHGMDTSWWSARGPD